MSGRPIKRTLRGRLGVIPLLLAYNGPRVDEHRPHGPRRSQRFDADAIEPIVCPSAFTCQAQAINQPGNEVMRVFGV